MNPRPNIFLIIQYIHITTTWISSTFHTASAIHGEMAIYFINNELSQVLMSHKTEQRISVFALKKLDYTQKQIYNQSDRPNEQPGTRLQVSRDYARFKLPFEDAHN